MRVTVIPVVVRALGMVPKDLEKLENQKTETFVFVV